LYQREAAARLLILIVIGAWLILLAVWAQFIARLFPV
jgi:hypothetical protein